VKKFVAAVCAVLVLCGSALSAELTFDPTKVVQGNVQIIDAKTCRGNIEVAVMTNEDGPTPFKLYFSEVTQRIVIISYDAKGDPQQVVFGVLSVVDGKPQVKTVEVLTLDEAKVKYPTPCDWLVKSEA
jgi:hypothetical protein